MQVVTDPDGRLLWLSPGLSGRSHDLTAARTHRIIRICERQGVPTLADLAYQGGGPWLTTGIKRRPLKELSPTEKTVNRALAAARTPVERGVARLKSWRIFRRSRCSRSSRTRSLSTVIPRSHPIRSAITVAGIVGVSRSSSRICTSTASTTEPLAGRSYFGGRSLASARLTVFFEMPRCRAIARIGICSARCSLRISAQSSTQITLSLLTSDQDQDQAKITKWVTFDPPSEGQDSSDADTDPYMPTNCGTQVSRRRSHPAAMICAVAELATAAANHASAPPTDYNEDNFHGQSRPLYAPSTQTFSHRRGVSRQSRPRVQLPVDPSRSRVVM